MISIANEPEPCKDVIYLCFEKFLSLFKTILWSFKYELSPLPKAGESPTKFSKLKLDGPGVNKIFLLFFNCINFLSTLIN